MDLGRAGEGIGRAGAAPWGRRLIAAASRGRGTDLEAGLGLDGAPPHRVLVRQLPLPASESVRGCRPGLAQRAAPSMNVCFRCWCVYKRLGERRKERREKKRGREGEGGLRVSSKRTHETPVLPRQACWSSAMHAKAAARVSPHVQGGRWCAYAGLDASLHGVHMRAAPASQRVSVSRCTSARRARRR